MRPLRNFFILALCFAATARGETLSERYRQQIDKAETLIRELNRYPTTPHIRYAATVSEVRALPNGTHEVVMRPTEVWRWQDGETPLDGNASLPGQLRWVWTEKGQPVPVAVGMTVMVRVDKDGATRAIDYAAENILAVRSDPGGGVKVVVQPAETRLLLLLTLRGMDYAADTVRWTDRHGLNWSTMDMEGDQGGPEDEVLEPSRVPRAGWSLANYPGERVLPGRDGWRSWSVVHAGNGSDHQEEDHAQYVQRQGQALRNLLAIISVDQWLPSKSTRELAQQVPAR